MGRTERPWPSMKKDRYISIADFAKEAGVTKQAVYSRQKSQDLNKFIKLENGKKLINTKALELFNKSSSQSSFNQSFNQVEQGLESTEREYIEFLKKQIEELQRDKQELYRLLDQQQQLTAQANATIKQLQASKEEASVIQQEKQEQKKQGFFARLFSRDN